MNFSIGASGEGFSIIVFLGDFENHISGCEPRIKWHKERFYDMIAKAGLIDTIGFDSIS